MEPKFYDNFRFVNKEVYNLINKTADCQICQNIVYNPKACSECGSLFCKDCINNSNCPNKCIGFKLVNPTSYHKRNLDQIVLKCKKAGCTVPLSEAYFHAKNCNTTELDIDCWSCHGKASSRTIKINEKKRTEIKELNLKSHSNQNNISLEEMREKIYGYQTIDNIETDRRIDEVKVKELTKKIIIKETTLAMIQKLEKEFNRGESLEELKKQLEESTKQVAMKRKETGFFYKDINEQKIEAKLEIFGHMNRVLCLTKISYNVIASGSQDNTIKLWNLTDGTCIKGFFKGNGHAKPVRCLELLDANRLASGSEDNKIKIFDIEAGKCILTLSGHSRGVNSIVKLNENLIASASSDMTIKIWDLKMEDFIRTLNGHTNRVLNIIKLNDTQIVSGSDDLLIKIWDVNLDENNCLKTLSGHTKAVLCLLKLGPDRIASGSWDNTIKIWNLESNTCIKTCIGHFDYVTCLVKLSETKMASGSCDNSIKIWSLETGNCIKNLIGHSGFVFCLLKLNEKQLVSGSSDKSIRIIDF